MFAIRIGKCSETPPLVRDGWAGRAFNNGDFMLKLILGLVLFFAVHLVPAFPDLRTRFRARLGEGAYKGLFLVVSLIGFALIVAGYGDARQAPISLWDPPVFTRHLAALLMLPVFPLLVAAYWKPGRIKAIVRHPMLAAVKIWALAHLISNGMLADLLLFGSFLAYGVFDRISVKKRELAGLIEIQQGPASNDVVPVILGIILYAVTIVWLHEWLIGVQIIPIGV